MAEDFTKAVEDGLKLAKRVYLGNDRLVAAAPLPSPVMERSSSTAYLPTAPMVYAVISDPAIVDNPDLPSYQPHVHGRCDPPALIPLQMNAVELEVDCYLDTALIRVTGSWRVHCVMGSRSCDCRIAIPMGEQGFVLGVEVEIPRKSYTTQLVTSEDGKEMEKNARPENGGFLKPNIFTLTIPQVDGGTNLCIKMSWSQKLLYVDGQFSVDVPFNFPEYVTPAVKKISKKEKIHLNLNAGAGTEILCKGSSHPLKEKMRNAGRLGFSYEADVLKWSNTDFSFSYVVSSSNIVGGLFLQSPPVHDVDQRDIFSIYLIPGSQQRTKVFKREVVFVVDLSGSMSGKSLEDVKNAISTALSKLSAGDAFNIITFSDNSSLFSTSMESATEEAVERSIQWMNDSFVAAGGTSMLPPLEKAVEMLSNTRGSVPMIFFITDGSVEDERHISNIIKKRLESSGSLYPRIYTFGIGIYCNHYFLRMLANISKGQHEAAYDTDHIEERMEKHFNKALSTILVNVTIEPLQNLDEVEVYPSNIPDLSSASPLIISGRCRGKFPENVKAKGLLGDFSSFSIDLTVQNAKDMLLDKLLKQVLAKNVIDMLTTEAWLSEDRGLQEKIAKLSIQTGVPSEYTRMILLENIEGPKPKETARMKKVDNETQKMVSRTIPLQPLGIGFGDKTATSENVQPGFNGQKPPDAAEMFVKAASSCCSSMCNKCCCVCCIQCCSKLNDQCVIVLTQLFSAVAFIACFECCSQVCCSGDDG
ncbi:PREDICTED: inter-alpha-trypsin inhibitor heavy chain H3-like isoform X3 [Tarenaya hassleriana]|uniref:inter-alpha-trypsin inhibitor heavy chain H3-like isoform X3 n=1 Tax=Tarenaya hassleriana TaxID=28532 RepID=UPI00053C430D|nr:PREDICTED: inter-alpha-trypsin inhibitor heavy chain H3-like isoform X3 [Tarenaya hassleriana]